MDEYKEKKVQVSLTLTVQVRKGHEEEDMSRALARFRVHVEENGPVNPQREDNGITKADIWSERYDDVTIVKPLGLPLDLGEE